MDNRCTTSTRAPAQAVLLGSSYPVGQPDVGAADRSPVATVPGDRPKLWGHGESGALPANTASLDDLARQHLALLDHLDIAQVNLVGFSVGGMWGARLALLAPSGSTAWC